MLYINTLDRLFNFLQKKWRLAKSRFERNIDRKA